jgi:hypothetical protein
MFTYSGGLVPTAAGIVFLVLLPVFLVITLLLGFMHNSAGYVTGIITGIIFALVYYTSNLVAFLI